MEIEWFVTDVTAVVSPDIVERAILAVILAGRCFDQWSVVLVLFLVAPPLEPDPLEPINS